METQAHVWLIGARGSVSPFCVPMKIPNNGGWSDRHRIAAKEPRHGSYPPPVPPASNAIGDAYPPDPCFGLPDAQVCGGAESAITPPGGWAVSLSARPSPAAMTDPATASRPFEAERNGFRDRRKGPAVCLKSPSTPAPASATILAEVVGYGQ